MAYLYTKAKKIRCLSRGSDDREFWQRAEARNGNTAELYADLGMTRYAAMEAFVRWHF